MKKYFNKFSESTKRMIVIISVTLMISSIIIAVVAIILYKDLEYLRGPRIFKHQEPSIYPKTKTNDLFMMNLKITDYKNRKYIEGEINNQSSKNYTYAYIIIGLYNNKKRSIGFAKTTIYDIPSRRSKDFKIPVDKKDVSSVKTHRIIGAVATADN